MTFLLSSENIFDYLVRFNLCAVEDRSAIQVTAKEYKNFNLLVNLGNRRSLLVKQERPNAQKNERNALWHEWRVCEFVRHFPELQHLESSLSEVVHFDLENSIIVLNYFENYSDCARFYADRQNQFFPTAIAASLGTTLATLHKSTFASQSYRAFLTQSPTPGDSANVRTPNFLRGLERVGPGLFSRISTDGIEFWKLYQRYESLHQSMVGLCETFDPCCLTHNDLGLRNILIDLSWNTSPAESPNSAPIVRLIDWEFFSWGDPACDLGMVLSGYLKIWLRSLVVSRAIDIQMALRLATTPLEKLQPSMVALLKSYTTSFPEILERHPNFLSRVMQFTGLLLIERIQGKLEQLDPFDNTGICTLQVAKALLCNSEQSILNVLGIASAEAIARPIPA
ncbi:phosphotransferase family protein [Altericista sp. CCNU0014]|uniref:phosphotransferase family protein n=1 Tax=Altericista sp. CCNU0014 TaxID=3082949 RepID=UPI00384F8633